MDAVKYRTSIEKDEINLLPPMQFDGEIILVETQAGARRALALLSQEKMVGFDTETKPAFTKGESYTPALLQLATKERAFIFRLKYFEIPSELTEFLSNPNILKVGVGIADDLSALKKIMTFTPQGFIELSAEARKMKVMNEGLRALTAIFLERRLLKGATRSNWEREVLTDAQISYAAIDALVGLLIYEKMINQKSAH